MAIAYASAALVSLATPARADRAAYRPPATAPAPKAPSSQLYVPAVPWNVLVASSRRLTSNSNVNVPISCCQAEDGAGMRQAQHQQCLRDRLYPGTDQAQ